MFSATTELYDLIYSFKDYASEAAQIMALIERERPGARSILDIASGTGEHARQLAKLGNYDITGIDIEPDFVKAAQEKLPTARFVCADMSNFRLSAQYDVILCLFSSIGYVKTLANVRRTLDRFREHLAPGGVILLEPWFTPEQLRPGHVHVVNAERDDVKVVRMSTLHVRDRISVLEFHYLIGRADQIEYRRETHELGVFTVDEMLECYAAAGLHAEFDEQGLTGRGLYIARDPNSLAGSRTTDK